MIENHCDSRNKKKTFSYAKFSGLCKLFGCHGLKQSARGDFQENVYLFYGKDKLWVKGENSTDENMVNGSAKACLIFILIVCKIICFLLMNEWMEMVVGCKWYQRDISIFYFNLFPHIIYYNFLLLKRSSKVS